MANIWFWVLMVGFWLAFYLYESDKKEQEKIQYKKRFIFPFTK